MNKKLFRQGGYIGGVCGGLGEWSGIPSILWRLAFICGLCVASGTFWIYILMWIFVKQNDNI